MKLGLPLMVLENWVLRRISGPNKEKVTGSCSKLQNKKLCNLHSLLYIIRIIKFRGMSWGDHAAARKEKFIKF
jgi:hypothetical protein